MPFDLHAISDAGIRHEFEQIQSRAAGIAQSLHAGYGSDRKLIAFRYIGDREFNAFALLEEEAYVIELNASVPLFAILLFSKLMSDAEVLHDLDSSGMRASDFAIPFVADPADFDKRVDWKIELNRLRAFAASTIADLCSTFVLCHEFGHILGGHVEGMEYYYGRRRIAELVTLRGFAAEDSERRQAWEFDADKIAVALLLQFIDELDANRADHWRTKAVFSDSDGFHYEHTLAIAVAALFAFFIYVQGMRTKLDRRSSHPHPYVRALYLKHMLLQGARDRRTVDIEAFDLLLDRRLDEMMIALERIGLLKASTYTRAYIGKAEREVDALAERSRKHRDSCAAWTWNLS